MQQKELRGARKTFRAYRTKTKTCPDVLSPAYFPYAHAHTRKIRLARETSSPLSSQYCACPASVYIYLSYVRRPRAPVWSPYGVFPCILRFRSTACYSELIEESVCLFAMDSTRREAALARRRERERARRANETAEERETRLARRRVRDRRANETSPSPNCSKYNSKCTKIVFSNYV